MVARQQQRPARAFGHQNKDRRAERRHAFQPQGAGTRPASTGRAFAAGRPAREAELGLSDPHAVARGARVAKSAKSVAGVPAPVGSVRPRRPARRQTIVRQEISKRRAYFFLAKLLARRLDLVVELRTRDGRRRRRRARAARPRWLPDTGRACSADRQDGFE